jgi:hypothetical protein
LAKDSNENSNEATHRSITIYGEVEASIDRRLLNVKIKKLWNWIRDFISFSGGIEGAEAETGRWDPRACVNVFRRHNRSCKTRLSSLSTFENLFLRLARAEVRTLRLLLLAICGSNVHKPSALVHFTPANNKIAEIMTLLTCLALARAVFRSLKI